MHMQLSSISKMMTHHDGTAISFMLNALFRTKSTKVGFTKIDHLAPM